MVGGEVRNEAGFSPPLWAQGGSARHQERPWLHRKPAERRPGPALQKGWDLTDPKKQELSDSWLLSESCPALLQAELDLRGEGSHLVPGWEGTRQLSSENRTHGERPRWPQPKGRAAKSSYYSHCKAMKDKTNGLALALRRSENGGQWPWRHDGRRWQAGCETRCPRCHPSCVPRRWWPWPTPSYTLHLTPATWDVKVVTLLTRRAVGKSKASARLGQELARRKRCVNVCCCHHTGIKSPCASRK